MNRKKFLLGLRDGLPVGLGYLTVSFSLGIAAQNIGMDAVQGFLMSLLGIASAGEYAAVTVMAADAGLLTMVVMTLVANARYLLMSCALSQKFSPDTPMRHRFFVGFSVTDELFGLAVAQEGYLNPYYYYGGMLASVPLWCIGTSLGIVVGNLMPARLVSAFSVTLFGMFIAIFIPAAKKDRVVLGCVSIGFLLSYLMHTLSVFSFLSEGTVIIVLTVLISAAAALLFPRKEEAE